MKSWLNNVFEFGRDEEGCYRQCMEVVLLRYVSHEYSIYDIHSNMQGFFSRTNQSVVDGDQPINKFCSILFSYELWHGIIIYKSLPWIGFFFEEALDYLVFVFRDVLHGLEIDCLIFDALLFYVPLLETLCYDLRWRSWKLLNNIFMKPPWLV